MSDHVQELRWTKYVIICSWMFMKFMIFYIFSLYFPDGSSSRVNQAVSWSRPVWPVSSDAGRLWVAFDATYLTPTHGQVLLRGLQSLVGGVWDLNEEKDTSCLNLERRDLDTWLLGNTWKTLNENDRKRTKGARLWYTNETDYTHSYTQLKIFEFIWLIFIMFLFTFDYCSIHFDTFRMFRPILILLNRFDPFSRLFAWGNIRYSTDCREREQVSTCCQFLK